VYDVGRHFEDEYNKRNSHLTNPTANVVGLQESLPMVTTFGLPMESNQWENCERTHSEPEFDRNFKSNNSLYTIRSGRVAKPPKSYGSLKRT
jgi:hypothetical protein